MAARETDTQSQTFTETGDPIIIRPIARDLHPIETGNYRVATPAIEAFHLLVAGFEVQDGCPAHGQGQLHGFTHDAASDEKFCAEMVALS